LKRKKELQKMMLEELDLDSYIEVLLGPDDSGKATTTETPMDNPQNGAVSPAEGPLPSGPGIRQPSGGIRQMMSKIPLIGQMLGG